MPWLKSHLTEILGLDQKRCINCGTPFFTNDLTGKYIADILCPDCQKQLQAYTGPRCRCCGLPNIPSLYTSQSDCHSPKRDICIQCAQDPPPWDNVAFHGIYTGELRDLLLRLKFDGEIPIARLLGEFLYNASSCLPKPDALVPIPQHPAHLRKRGYNQAHELARELARFTGLPLLANLLRRVEHGRPQERLTAKERKANLISAFKSSQKAKGQHIWLIDDIVTTGSTCRAATLALKTAGAVTVSLLFAARTGLE